MGYGSLEDDNHKTRKTGNQESSQEAVSYISIPTTFYPGSRDDSASSDPHPIRGLQGCSLRQAFVVLLLFRKKMGVA